VAKQSMLGFGVGWRAPLADFIAARSDIDFVEVVAETLDPAAPLPAPLAELRERGVKVVPHGVGLSLGGAEPLSERRLERLARLAERLDAPLVSEHLCFVRAGGVESGHLLPLPFTEGALELLCENLSVALSYLPVPLAVENIATLVRWPEDQLSEQRFVSEVCERSGARLLLDLANLYANARNHGFDPVSSLDALPLSALAYVHVAGGVERAGRYHDTHTHAVPTEVFGLVEELCARVEPAGLMLERDGGFGALDGVSSELDELKVAMRRGAGRRAGDGR